MKTNRKAAAVLTAGLLALSISPCFGMTAFAEGETTPTYSITVQNETEGYTYQAYQIFKGDITEKDGKTVLSNIKWADDFSHEAFLTALKGATEFGTAFASVETADDVAAVLKGISDTDQLAAFAKLAKASAGAVKATATKNDGYVLDLDETGGGYYLVEESVIPGGDSTNVYSRFMLNVVGQAEATPKRPQPDLTKKITDDTAKDEGKANQVSIGDTVNYELKTKVPDMTGYTKYFFIIEDTMAKGLTFDDNISITLEGQTDPIAASLYEVTVDKTDDNTKFKIVFKDFYTNFKANAGKDITVTYSATLNENADRTTAGNLNTANLTYSNNPNVTPTGGNEPTPDNPETPEVDESDPIGKTPDQQTKTYTANIKLTKVDGANAAKKLTGAKFQLTGTKANIVLINGKAYKEDAAGTYYKLTDGTFTDDADAATAANRADDKKYALVKNVDKTTTNENICMDAYVNANGELEFGGLGAGTYEIKELIAPEGYNLLANPIKVVIDGSNVSFAKPNWTATKDGTTIDDMTDTATAAFEVQNNEGTTLPSTGGIGNKIFYVLGAIFAVGSGIYLVTRKRMAGVEQ